MNKNEIGRRGNFSTSVPHRNEAAPKERSLTVQETQTGTPPLKNRKQTHMNSTGWHHATNTFHRPRPSLHKPRTRVPGFLLDSRHSKMGPVGCTETSVRNYHSSLRNDPTERSSHLLRGGSMWILLEVFFYRNSNDVFFFGSTRWFKYDWDWFVCKQAELRSSCATLREWSHNLHPPSCSG